MQRLTSTTKQSASDRAPRETNRNLLFQLIRRRGSLSRADLTVVSGLQRSTVSLAVDELLADRWIVEHTGGKSPRARTAALLKVNPARAVLAIDIHPSQTIVALVDLAGDVLDRSLIEIPEDPNRTIQAVLTAVRKLMAAHPQLALTGIGISLPGRLDPTGRKLMFAPHIVWPVLTLKPRLERATGLRVEMDNIANACALAEVWYGEDSPRASVTTALASPAPYDRVVVNVSEVICTGIIANGELLRGERGMAGEFGHVQLEPDGVPCACGSNGCWETLASNTAALRFYKAFGGREKDLDFSGLVALALERGDRSAKRALQEVACNLGRGARMIASALAPREIVIVGEIVAAWELCAPLVQAELHRHSLSRATTLRPGRHGTEARLRSAVALVLSDGSLRDTPGSGTET